VSTDHDAAARKQLLPEDFSPLLPGPAGTDYENYLRTDELLALQKTPAEMGHRDELIFQTVHQTSELWLKLCCHEVDESIALLDAGEGRSAVRLLARAGHVITLVTESLHVLERMQPWDFHGVRRALGHGSGFDSPGFRELRGRAPGLYAAFERWLAGSGATLVTAYTDARAHGDAFDLAEVLIELDERIAIWRDLHVKMVQRAIGGGSIGTQGTPVAVLQGLTERRLFPALWDVRNELTVIANR
jgi:tryptophan 2,3-dioxygenase